MLLELGPVPSVSAIAYVAFCRDRLAEIVAEPGELAATMTPEVAERFSLLLDAWQQAADAGPVFVWEQDIDVEALEYHIVAFVRVVLGSDPIGRSSESAGDPDVELRRPFRVALVNGTLNALEREGSGSSALAADLRSQWPDDDIA